MAAHLLVRQLMADRLEAGPFVDCRRNDVRPRTSHRVLSKHSRAVGQLPPGDLTGNGRWLGQAVAYRPRGRGGGGGVDPGTLDNPSQPPQIRKFFLRGKMKFIIIIKGAGKLRPIPGTQTLFGRVPHPPPRGRVFYTLPYGLGWAVSTSRGCIVRLKHKETPVPLRPSRTPRATPQLLLLQGSLAEPRPDVLELALDGLGEGDALVPGVLPREVHAHDAHQAVVRDAQQVRSVLLVPGLLAEWGLRQGRGFEALHLRQGHKGQDWCRARRLCRRRVSVGTDGKRNPRFE